MAIKASATVTLTFVRDVSATYRYYKLQASTASAPDAPTTTPTSTPSGWSDTEPSYTEGSTNTLYFCDGTVYSNGEWSYSSVSISSSYEAAKSAYNKAVAAGDAAQNAQDDIDGLEIGGRNLVLNSKQLTTASIPGTETTITYDDDDFGVCTWAAIETAAWRSLNTLPPRDVDDILGDTLTLSFMARSDDWESISAATDGAPIYVGIAGCTSSDTTRTMYRTLYSSSANSRALFTSGDWFKFTLTFTVGEDVSWFSSGSGEVERYFVQIFNYSTFSTQVKQIKLERGDKATDWTPAPEDVDANISDAQNTADDAKTQADANKENITTANVAIDALNGAISSLVTGANGVTLLTQTDDGWIFDMSSVTDRIDDISRTLNKTTEFDGEAGVLEELENQSADISNLQNSITTFNNLNAYVKIVKETDEDGNLILDEDGNAIPLIELGNEKSRFKVRITNTSIDFMEGLNIPAYINNQQLNIDTAQVDNELKIGNFAFVPRTNGNLGLVWKG